MHRAVRDRAKANSPFRACFDHLDKFFGAGRAQTGMPAAEV